MSPVRPENRARYGADWPTFARTLKDAAGWRCECRGECGRPPEHLDDNGRCHNLHGQPARGTGSTVVLTVAHLCHTPECRHPDHLRVMCQGCHLHHDRAHHAETRTATLDGRRGQGRLL